MSNEVHYGMVIDTEHCVGCQTCTISCKISNEVPGSAHWNHLESLDGDVLYQATGAFPRTRLAFRPMLCGLVLVDQDRCIACGYCTWTCPYGAPSMDDAHHVMSKCTFCKDRIAEGQKPFCAEACPANARVFGDLNDPESEPSRLLQQKKGVQYLPEMGTNPSVYYV